MDQYDSDSSFDDDAASGVATSVLLGYATPDTTGDEISHLGGEPSWLDEAQPPSASLASCKSCNTHMPILLQLNGALPDRFPGHERRLYIWGCPKRRCRRKEGSMRAIRAVRVDPSRAKQTPAPTSSTDKSTPVEQQQPQKKADIGAQLFGGSGNPFSSSSTTSNTNPFSSTANPSASLSLANPFSTSTSKQSQTESAATLSQTFAEKARISTPQTSTQSNPQESTGAKFEEELIPWPTSDLPTPYPHYYLDADYEYLSPTTKETNGSSSKHYDALMDIDGNAAGSSGSGGAGDKDLYESEHDKTFQHFADTLSQNPEQVLRYEFGGSPLLYARTDAIGRLISGTSTSSQQGGKITTVSASNAASTSNGSDISSRVPRCTHCGSTRAFEVQLTPHAIAELEADEEPAKMLTEGMEWGAVIVAVCSKDCVPDSSADGKQVVYREEWCGVQWEETVKREGASGSKAKS